MASKAANTAEAPEAREEAAEAPLLNTVEAAIKKMVAKGKERGYVTYDEVNAALPTEQVSSEQIGRTDDPVRMYLREMGSVELLSREGEIAIAKRIEAGREMMIGGLCESPLTMRALIGWRDALNEGKMLLRDIIDLDATYGSTFAPEEVIVPAEGAPESADEEAPAPAEEV